MVLFAIIIFFFIFRVFSRFIEFTDYNPLDIGWNRPYLFSKIVSFSYENSKKLKRSNVPDLARSVPKD